MTYYTAGVDEIHMLAREHALAETGLVNGESMSEPFASLIDMSGYQPDAGIADGEGGLEAPPSGLAQRPPRLLLTLLGDYWWQQTEPLPSAALVALLAEFGVSDSAARAALRWLGFAPLYDGVWVSPRDHATEVVQRLTELGITTATAFRATTAPGISLEGLPQRAWDLENLQAKYDHFITSAAALRDRILAGQVSPVAGLVARKKGMDEGGALSRPPPPPPHQLLPP